MKFVALVATVLFAAPAFSMTIECTNNPGVDSMRQVTLSNTEFGISFWESGVSAKAGEFSVITGKNFEGKNDTVLAVIDNKKLTFSAEGEESKVVTSAVFSYNPQQRAGRLTIVMNGGTSARNELFQNCTQK